MDGEARSTGETRPRDRGIQTRATREVGLPTGEEGRSSLNDETEGVRAEARKTKETAERLANGDYPEGADHIRVLAGMISQLAEQVERLASPGSDISNEPRNDREVPPGQIEGELEEDRTPEEAPADPSDDPATT